MSEYAPVVLTGAVYLANLGDYVFANATAQPITVTLPPPVSAATIRVKKTDTGTNIVTINTLKGLIDGAATFQILAAYQAVIFVSDGTNWFVDGERIIGPTGASSFVDVAARSFTASPNSPYVASSAPGTIENEYWLPFAIGGGADDAAAVNTVMAAAIANAPAIVRAVPGQTYTLKSAPINITGGPLTFDYRGSTLKLAAVLTFLGPLLNTNRYPPHIYVTGGADITILEGTIDGGNWVPIGGRSSCGIIVNGNASRVHHEGGRVINCTLWAHWVPYGIDGVLAFATAVTYWRCRTSNCGTLNIDGGGFKCEGTDIHYGFCNSNLDLAFGWDLAPGSSPTDNVSLLECEATLAAAVTLGIGVFFEDFTQNDIRVIGGQFQSFFRAVQIYGGPGSRYTLLGVTTKAATAGSGTGILIGQGSSTGGRIRIEDTENVNWSAGINVACISGQGAGSVSDVTLMGNDCSTCTNGIVLSNNAAGPSTLSNLTIVNNDCNGCTNPLVLTTHTANGGGQNIVIDNNLGINPRAVQSPAFAASFTPNLANGTTIAIGALTNNIVINNPAQVFADLEITLIMLQDGTGGRTASWGTAYDTVWNPVPFANSLSTITLRHDGTKFRQIAGQLAVDAGGSALLMGTLRIDNGGVAVYDSRGGNHQWKKLNTTSLMILDPNGNLTNIAGHGVWGHAAPATQPAAPVTLADVIAIIRGCGLSA